MLQGLNQLGVRTRNSEIILPIAVALFRATGPAMNFGVALYIAHLMGIELTAGQIALGLAAGAITTMGAVSLPGSISFISSIAPICIAMGVPRLVRVGSVTRDGAPGPSRRGGAPGPAAVGSARRVA